jgi:hypothetical protein
LRVWVCWQSLLVEYTRSFLVFNRAYLLASACPTRAISAFGIPNIIRQIKSRGMRWAGHVACMGEERNVYKVLVEKPEGKRPLERPRHRWDQNGSYGDWLGECRLAPVGPG